MASAAIKEDIKNKLGYVNTTFFDQAIQSLWTGGDVATGPFSGFYDYTSFPLSAQPNIRLMVYDASKSTAYTQIATTADLKTFAAVENQDWQKLAASDVVFDGIGDQSIVSLLNVCRLANAIVANAEILVQLRKRNFSIYSISGADNRSRTVTVSLDTTNNGLTTTASDAENAMIRSMNLQQLFSNDYALQNTDLFMFQRLMNLYEKLINVMIAMRLYYNAPGEDNLNILRGCYVRLMAANKVLDTLKETSGSLQQRVKDYQNNSRSIDNLNENIKDQRANLGDKIDALAYQESQNSTANYFLYGAIALLVATIGANAWGFTVASTERRLQIQAAVLVVTIVGVITINVVGVSMLEPFATAATLYANPSTADFTDVDKTAVLDAFQLAILDQMYQYLNNSIFLSLMFKTDKAYANVNFAMKKEMNQFEEKRDTGEMQIGMARSRARLIGFNEENTRVSTYYTLIFAVVIAAAAVGRELLPDQYILPIAALILVIVAAVFIVDLGRIVRTDGRKMYWSKPATQSS